MFMEISRSFVAALRLNRFPHRFIAEPLAYPLDALYISFEIQFPMMEAQIGDPSLSCHLHGVCSLSFVSAYRKTACSFLCTLRSIAHFFGRSLSRNRVRPYLPILGATNCHKRAGGALRHPEVIRFWQ